MKKAFDQTFRDIKRGVNKKVLKVPSIEQKVLDATSNEPWGPHGTHLAEIAMASRNYHEYQMIMSVVWKRLSDTGKNWRHVFKALTILEYLVANGSERVIEDIREHAYQISMLSSFQYIDSVGRDQGINVRKKSQSLVALVNDKEKIQEARDKAATNRDKFRNTPGGGMSRPYDDEDRNGYGREKEWGDDRNGRQGDSYGRDGGRYSDEHYGRDEYKDDEYRGRSRSVDGDNGPRSRSSDRDRERAFEDDGHNSSRESNARVEDGSMDGSRLESKLSGQNPGAPPSYEDVVGDGRSPVHAKRDGETVTTFASPPHVNTNHQETMVSSISAAPTPPAAATLPPPALTSDKENDGFDFFDPRGASPAAPPPAGGAEMDLLGSLSDSFSSNALALVPSTSAPTEAHVPTNPNPGQTFMAAPPASGGSTQPFDDPFGDGPFRAVPTTDGPFGAVPSSGSPFGAVPSTNSPFGAVPSTEGPFGAIPSTDGPFGPVPTTDSPFGAVPSTEGPFGAVPTTEGPFGSVPSTDGPFGPVPSTDGPFGAAPSTNGPFGPLPSTDGPFGPVPSTDGYMAQPQTSPFTTSSGPPHSVPPSSASANNSGFSDTFDQSIDILADILPPTGPSQTAFQPQSNQLSTPTGFPSQTGQPSQTAGYVPQSSQSSQTGYVPQPSQPSQTGFVPQLSQPSQMGFVPQSSQPSQTSFMPQSSQPSQTGYMPQSSQPSQTGYMPQSSQPSQTGYMPQSSQPSQTGFVPQSSQPPQTGYMPQSSQPSQTGYMPQSSQPSQTGYMPQSSQPSQTGYMPQPSQPSSQPGFPSQPNQTSLQPSFQGQFAQPTLQPSFPTQGGPPRPHQGFQSQSGQSMLPSGFGPSIPPPAFPVQGGGGHHSLPPPSFPPQSRPQPGYTPQDVQNASLGGFSSGFPSSNGHPARSNNFYGGFQPQGSSAPVPPMTQVSAPQYTASSFYQQPQVQSSSSMASSQPAVTGSTGALAITPQQPAKEKFETKSTVWTDTLNRGLVNLNISGSKTNPLSDIGIDFEAINRKEKRMEKPSKTPVTSNVTMGKAMGSGSGIGRAGAGALRAAPNPMVPMGSAPGYGGLNPHQPMGMNHMGVGMNNGQGFPMQPPAAAGFPPAGSYNPMVGRGGGYGQQPYGGYR